MSWLERGEWSRDSPSGFLSTPSQLPESINEAAGESGEQEGILLPFGGGGKRSTAPSPGT